MMKGPFTSSSTKNVTKPPPPTGTKPAAAAVVTPPAPTKSEAKVTSPTTASSVSMSPLTNNRTDLKESKDLSALRSETIRQQWIETQLQVRTKEFTEEKKLIVYVGTWNVNAKKPTEELSTWIVTEPFADVYAIGFQEIVDLNASNLLVDHNASKPWEDKIEKTLKGLYTQVCSKHLVGLSLVIYVKKTLFPLVTDIQFDTAGVGIMGRGGNKGACAIRFMIHDSSFCFVNSHLAAHQHNVAGRNSDFRNICDRLKFTDKVKATPTFTLYDHDLVFWLGDLNYRINMTDMNLAFQRIEAADWPYLLSHDQLLVEKAAGNAFKRFKEGAIDFAPTYKYQPGTHKYERREGKKKRMPAWCDRIQWVGEDVKQLSYKRAELTCSDHKPVYALFDVAAKILVPERKKAVVAALARQLDAWENENIPKVNIVPTSVSFGHVIYDQPCEKKVVIHNTGQVIAAFHFSKGDEDSTKPWLKVNPEFGIIPPADSVEVTITVHVRRDTALPLNSGIEPLEDVVRLTVDNGGVSGLAVQGTFLKTCWGSSIDFLVHSAAPARTAATTKDASKVLPIPKELWRMVDFMYRSGMDKESLFTSSGDPAEIEKIRECLDTGTEFANFSMQSMSDALIIFLQNLADPVFPMNLVNQYADGMNLTGWCKQALLQLPPAHYNTFIYIIQFLREVLKHSVKNRLTANSLVMAFTSALMQAEPTTEASHGIGSTTAKPKSWTILRHFLTSEEFNS